MSLEKFKDKNYTPNASTAEELNKAHKDGESLTGLYLAKADLRNSYLVDADMSGCDLTKTNLSESSMYGINLSGSNLFKADLEGANLKNANLERCNLLGANLTDAKLEGVNWGKDCKVINEIEADELASRGETRLANEKYKEAEHIYRTVKISLQSQTLGDDTGEFFMREMVVIRKQLPMFSLGRLWSKIIDITTGYGEKIGNIVYTIVGIIVACAFLYGIEGVKYGDHTLGFFNGHMEQYGGFLNTIGDLLYFSVVVYSTVGFGEIVPLGPLGKTIMVFEGMVGGLVLAILIIAMYKKSMDR